ncbi:arylsulfatase [Halioxenophilus sp. WMMB6]|uniref:arylsulfatase n=1 Tax=Halioxenophilus sp. WMMB6 TaxID=3073815 RepID=UPI00295EEE5D|nr:arylsulfatase [Halioxenophilus sp. WMMB6]
MNTKNPLLFLILSLCITSALASSQRPNVLLVVADDLGYTDLGSFGGEIQTPNLDALAQSGMRLTQFYTAATCSPTRAMLMTGTDHHRVGLGTMAEALAPNQRGKPGYEGFLNDRAAFLPKAFADAGYRTLMSGKWHLGLDEQHSPAAKGFQQSFALLDGGAGHFSDLGIDKMHASFRENGKPAQLPKDFYSSRFYTDKMIDYIDSGKNSGQPFFGYLAYTAPHWPLQAPDDSIKKYQGHYAMGYDQLHQERVENAKSLGLAPQNATTAPRQPGQKAWRELSSEEQKIEQRKMEIYAAMVDDMDRNFGRLLIYLQETGQFDNTIIFFMSDNGAEGATLEDGVFKKFVPHVQQCCDNSYENLGKPDSYLFYGPNWARASVGPARDFKGDITEGGIHSPAFIVYPGMKERGSISQQFVSVKDVLPTLLNLANIPLPVDQEVAVEGHSLFTEAGNTAAMGWELFGGKAYRYGEWKLVRKSPRMGETQWQLFNLVDDPMEQQDLSAQQPAKFQQLMQRWADYEQGNGIIYPQRPSH